MNTSNHSPEPTDPFAPGATSCPSKRWLVACFAGALVCGTLGFHQYHGRPDEQPSWSNSLYHTVQLFALHAPHFEQPVPLLLEIGRWLAAATTLLTVYGVGRRLFREEIEEWRCGRLTDHVVVCGLGRKGLAEVHRQRRADREVIALEREPDEALLAECRRLGAHVLAGDATKPELLRDARVAQAGLVVSLLPEDSANCEVAAQVANLCCDAGGAAAQHRVRCRVHLSDPDLRQALQDSLHGGCGAGAVRLEFVDGLDEVARRLLVEKLPLDHEGIGLKDPHEAHLILIGMGRLGRRIAVRAAQLGQLANGRPLRITVIDRKPDANRNGLLFHHPGIEAVCRWKFHSLDVFSPEGRKLLQELCAEQNALTSLVVAFDEEERALEIAALLRTLAPDAPVRVALRMHPGSGLDKLIGQSAQGSSWIQGVRRFGTANDADGGDSISPPHMEDFARQVHESYVAVRRVQHEQEHPGQPLPTDPTLLPWEEIREDFRESSRQQADHLFIKLRALGCESAPTSDPRPDCADRLLENLEWLAELEHRRFVAERAVAGWTYASGPKDPVRRTNPTLVEWSKLEDKIKDYDREAIRSIPAKLARLQLKVVARKPGSAPA